LCGRYAAARGAISPYLRTRGLDGALPTVGAAVVGAGGLVLVQLGTASVEPTDGQLYDPTDGATTDPTEVPDCPEVPACARAAELERANAIAMIVVSFMVVLSRPPSFS
jgi:hypothetical protein